MPSLPPIDRAGFPILERRIGKGEGRPLVYLDSAATALVPERVVRAVERFYATSCANIHRGAHALAEEATDAYECAREDVARFFGVQDAGRVVLTHGATESMHLAAFGWAEHALAPGDVVAVAEDNHHANVVCWHQLARRRGVEVAWIPVDGQGRLDYAAWCAVAERGPKLVALAHQSNVLGFRQPALARIMDDARGVGACIVLDGAQAAGHEPFAFDEARVDFYALSAHKMMGLTGIGALLCSERAFARMEPVVGGGGMVERVDREGFVPASGPAAYEAGTPAIAAAVAWREALALLGEAGLDRVVRPYARARDPCGTGAARRSGRHGAGGRLPAVRVARELRGGRGASPRRRPPPGRRGRGRARGTPLRAAAAPRVGRGRQRARQLRRLLLRRGRGRPGGGRGAHGRCGWRREAHGDASHGAARKDAAMNLDDEAVMERHRNPRFKGFSGPGDVAATGDNPFCGDALEVRVVRGEADGAPMVARAAFDGYACSLCAATADLVMEHVTGMRVEDAERLTVDDVLALWGGLQVGRTRRGCVELPLTVLKRALALLQ